MNWEREQPIAAIATTTQAVKILQNLSFKEITIWVPPTLKDLPNTHVYYNSLAEHLASIWHQYQAFIFCLAAGAVVRLIAPLLKNKADDPAILVIDSEGKFAISLCGCHQGGADKLARLIAQQLEAIPVLTGASNYLELPGIDVFGIPFGWQKGTGNWTGVSAAIARGETVQVIQEVGSNLWQQHLPQQHSFSFGFPEDNQAKQEVIKPQARVWISATKRKFAAEGDLPKVQWHPRVLWIGIGCERGVSKKLVAAAIEQVCQRYHLATAAIAGIASIDLKADEWGIVEFCQEYKLPFKTFRAEELALVEVPNPSQVVAQEVGTPSVAEAAALLASQAETLLVSKQIVKLPGETGAVTLAIALADVEYTGRLGKLYLVGIGPGSLDQMTSAAKTAVIEADAVIGYSLYIDLIAPLFRLGQIVESLPITQEQARAKRALELAQWGLTVAVVSSGDCGIYGMAGLVLEQLVKNYNWDGKVPTVRVFPGISALQAAASRVGAPLMHDFCAISLSDLLTPWSVILKRIEAAAAADFVTAIYNPKSLQRTQQIVVTQEIFLQYRQPNTPVALVYSAYREDERIIVTTLQEMLQFPIDMLTTVIIGNSNTSNYADWLITPRAVSE